jgi:HPt (histidine-containing phosphotransfer) domain-containing protein
VDSGAVDDLAEQFGGGEEGRRFARELTATFLDDTPAQLAALRGAVAEGDAGEARRAAHSMKSNAATFGATSFSALCAQLEALARQGSLEGADALLVEAEQEWVRVQGALGGDER